MTKVNDRIRFLATMGGVKPEEIAAVVRRALRTRNTTAFRAARDAGLPGNAIRHLLEGRDSRISRLAEIFDAFEDYSTEEANLGPGPRQQLRVLREYVPDGVEEAGRAEYRLQVGAIHRHQFERTRQGTGPFAWPTRGQLRYTPRQ